MTGMSHRSSRLERFQRKAEKLRGNERVRERRRMTVIITTALMTFAGHHGGGPVTTGKQLYTHVLPSCFAAVSRWWEARGRGHER